MMGTEGGVCVGDHPPFVMVQDSTVSTAGFDGADVRGGGAHHLLQVSFWRSAVCVHSWK